MATKTQKPRPVRAILLLLLAMILGVGGMALSQTWEPKLGLDLQGGTSILLRAKAPKEGPPEEGQMNEAIEIIRNRVGDLAEAEVSKQGDEHILVEVPGAGNDQARKLVGQTAELRFRQVLFLMQTDQPKPKPSKKPTSPSKSPSAPPSKGPSKEPGEKPTVKPGGSGTPTTKNRAVSGALANAETPDPKASKDPKKDPKTSPSPSKDPNDGKDGKQPTISTTQPSEKQLLALSKYKCPKKAGDYDASKEDPKKVSFGCDEKGATKFLLGPAIMSGRQVSTANAGVPQNSTQWAVQLKMNGEGSKQFFEASKKMTGLTQPLDQFAIVLDGRVISAPQFNEPIPGGQAEITGDFTEQQAQDLAQVLRYGSLPLSFTEEEAADVSPTLGGDQLQGGLLAGAIGLLLVVLYCCLYYRALGLVVVSSLVVAAGMTYEAAVLLGEGQGFTLTLAGVAGLIVAIGITADSFVVYFERLRDELRDGRTYRTAVETAWVRARRTIIAADSISLLAAIVLYVLSVGGVRSFAYALGLTTVIDIIVVFFFTKPLMTLLGRTKFFQNGHPMSGVSPERLGVPRRRFVPGFATRSAQQPAAEPSGPSGPTVRPAIEEA